MSDKNEKDAIQEEEAVTQEQEEQASSESAENQESTNEENHEFGEAESENPLDQLQRQLEEEKNKYLRLYAEFENFRRRNAKERIELIGSASSELMTELLPLLDDFERAIDSNQKSEDLEAVKQGFELLHQKMTRVLSAKGLKAIESKGETFDAEVHEAIAQVPVDDKKQKGQIIDVVEKGYSLNDKVIRHPKVVVGS